MKRLQEIAPRQFAARGRGHKNRADGTRLPSTEHSGAPPFEQRRRVKRDSVVPRDATLLVSEELLPWERELLLSILLAAFQEVYSDGATQAA